MASGRRFFLVKWAAKYGKAKDSWEPEDNLTAMLIEEWEDKVAHRYVHVPGGSCSYLIILIWLPDIRPAMASTMHYLGSELQRQMGIGISLFKMGRTTSRVLIVDVNMPVEV